MPVYAQVVGPCIQVQQASAKRASQRSRWPLKLLPNLWRLCSRERLSISGDPLGLCISCHLCLLLLSCQLVACLQAPGPADNLHGLG